MSTRLFILLCLSLLALVPHRAHAQQGQSPVVRPRTVRPKEAAAPTPTTQPSAAPTPANNAAAQPQPSPTQTTPAKPDAQQSDTSQDDEVVDENEVVRVESNLVIIPASVVDFRGRAVADLKVEDFELKIDGEVKTIGDLSRAETPVNVALLFDNSASLSAAREFEKQAAVRFFQSVVRPIDKAAVYSISTTPTLSQGLTSDVQRLVRTIQNFGKPDGATALFDTLAQAADYMRPLTGRKVLVVVSDGTDTVSDATFEDAVNRALLAECQVYVVQTRQVENPNLHDTVSEQRMMKLTEQTGGAVFVPRSVEELDSVFSQISLDLSQQYLLSYNPQDERRDKFFRFISLRVKTRPNLRVRARKGFYPTAAQTGTSQPPDPRTQAPMTSQTQSRTGYVASAPSTTPNAGAQGRASANGTPARRDSAAARRPGPAGPDIDEHAKPAPAPAPAAEAGQPSFTLKTVAAVTTPNVTTTNAPANTTTGAAAHESNTPTPAPVPTPTPAPTQSASTTNLFSNAPAPTPAATQPTPARPEPSPTPQPTPVTTGAAQPAAKESAAAAGEAPKQKVPISGGVLNSKAVSLPRPDYPSAAKSVGAQGKVVVELTIDESGRVTKARAVSGHPLLQKAAVAAALQARFSPTVLSGEPVSIKGTISYTFVLQ